MSGGVCPSGISVGRIPEEGGECPEFSACEEE